MSRSVLVASSSLLLALAGCAEEDASLFFPDASADAGSSTSATSPRADTPVGMDAGAARPDASTRADGGPSAPSGLDASGPRTVSTERAPITGGASGSTTAPGATVPGTPSTGPVIADGTVRTDLAGTEPEQTPPPPDAPRQPLIEPRGATFDARSYTDWLFLDLESGQSGGPDLPGWDVALRRMDVQLNAGAVQASLLDGASFDGVARAPANGWTGDGADGADENTDPDWFISTVGEDGEGTGWWNYDATTHVLTPKPRVYAVRTVEGRFFKLAVDGYYNNVGTSGYLTLRWAEVEAP